MILYSTNALAVIFITGSVFYLPFKSSLNVSISAFCFGVLLWVFALLLEIKITPEDNNMEPKIGRRID